MPACFSQSQQPTSQVESGCDVVATNSGTELYESSLLCLLTEDILSLLFFCSLCISLYLLPPSIVLFCCVFRSCLASVLLYLIFLFHWGKNFLPSQTQQIKNGVFLSLFVVTHLFLCGCSSLIFLEYFVLFCLMFPQSVTFSCWVSFSFFMALSLQMLSMHFIMHQCITENSDEIDNSGASLPFTSAQLSLLYSSSCFFSLWCWINMLASQHEGVSISPYTESSISKYIQIMGKHIFKLLFCLLRLNSINAILLSLSHSVNPSHSLLSVIFARSWPEKKWAIHVSSEGPSFIHVCFI